MHGTTILLRRIEGRRLWDVARSCLRASGPRHAGVGTIDKGETGGGGGQGTGEGGGDEHGLRVFRHAYRTITAKGGGGGASARSLGRVGTSIPSPSPGRRPLTQQFMLQQHTPPSMQLAPWLGWPRLTKKIQSKKPRPSRPPSKSVLAAGKISS